MVTATTPSVSEITDQFYDQGYYILRGVLSPEVVAGARREMEIRVDRFAEVLYAQEKLSNFYKDEPFETRLYKLYETHMEDAPRSFRPEINHLPGLFPLYFNPGVLDIIEQILGSEIRLYPNYFVRPKFPDHAGTLVLWHQDAAYTVFGKGDDANINDLRMINLWSSLVPATKENGCMQFVPGSHKLGVVRHVEKPGYLEIAPEVLEQYADQAVDIETEPGDVVFFSNLMFHWGQPNRSKMVRWSADWRYQDARQSTLRTHEGHLARSKMCPERVVKTAEEWAKLTLK